MTIRANVPDSKKHIPHLRVAFDSSAWNTEPSTKCPGKLKKQHKEKEYLL